MKAKIILIALFITLLMSLAMPAVVGAQDPTPDPSTVSDDEVNAVAKDLYCPVCENTPLDVCPTQACAEWRELIREKLAAGWSETEIKDYFVSLSGQRVLGAPPARGFNLVLYASVIVGMLAALGILFVVLRRTVKPKAVEPGPAQTTASEDDEYVRRIEAELNRRMKGEE